MTQTQPAPAANDRRPPLPPVGHGLGQNLRAVAQRLAWPDGALAACQAIEADHPGWSAYYALTSSLSYGAPGYRATCAQITYPERPLYGQTAAALREQITAYLGGAYGPPS